MLRPYQDQAINEIRAHFAAGRKKVLLHLATGGGKTHIFSYLLKSLYENGKHGVMAVRGRKLVDQASHRLIREKVPHGVHMAGHWLTRSHERIQICSIDTLRSRSIVPKADLVVIDEAHMATADTYKNFLAHYPDAFILGVTATPYTEKSLRHLADVVVHPISMEGLIKEGFLVPPRYCCPFEPDLKGVKISSSTHDYVVDQLSMRMEKPHVVGDIVTEWKARAGNKPTVCFAVTIRHSLAIVESFNDAGIPARHIEAGTPDDERLDAIEALRTGEIRVLSNVGILCTGVDLPWLECLILARPTQSYCLYVQQMGRGTRVSEGKENFLVLDHAGNVVRHGFISDERTATLDGDDRRVGTSKVKVCKECFAAYLGSKCPECGAASIPPVANTKQVRVQNGELTEITPDFMERVRAYARESEAMAREKGYAQGWVFHRVKNKYGEALAKSVVRFNRIPRWLLGTTKN